jgi:hypothetical protein
VLLSVAGLGYILNYSHIAGKLVPSGTTGLQRALTTVRQDRAQYLAVGTLPAVGPEMHRWGQNRWSWLPLVQRILVRAQRCQQDVWAGTYDAIKHIPLHGKCLWGHLKLYYPRSFPCVLL